MAVNPTPTGARAMKRHILTLTAFALGLIWIANGEPVASVIWHATAFILIAMDDE